MHVVRLAVVAFCSLVASSQGPRQPKAVQKHDVAASDQRGTEAAPLVVKRDSSERDADAREHAEERSDKRAADRALVGYTKGLFIATALLSGVTLLLWLATAALVRDARESSRREMRAYVHFVFASYDAKTERVTMRIENFGRTPAHDVKYMLGVTEVARATFDADFWKEQRIEAGSVLAPGAPSVIPSIQKEPLTPARLAAIVSAGGDRAIFAFGRVDYVDVFGQRHWTRFCFVCADQWLSTGEFAPHSKGNDTSDSARLRTSEPLDVRVLARLGFI
ncbi:MAG: hypothetical protein HY275_10100 [Gemmatimonadetes bacterium]|nr:hypothetical protein [Gemmatimonadota bacterium]